MNVLDFADTQLYYAHMKNKLCLLPAAITNAVAAAKTKMRHVPREGTLYTQYYLNMIFHSPKLQIGLGFLR